MENVAPRRRGLPVACLLLGSLGAIIGFSWSEKDYVAAFAVGMTAACGLWGFYLGALRLLGTVAGLVAAYQYAPMAASWIAAKTSDSLSSSEGMTRTISLGIAWLAITAFVTTLAKIVSRRLSESSDRFKSANQMLGFGVGGAQGALGTLVLLSGVVVVAPLANERLLYSAAGDNDIFARTAAEQIVEIADQTQRSTLGQLVERYNPFENLPQLKQIQGTVAVIQDPLVFARIAEHPAMAKLQTKPSVRAAMNSLAKDPELRKLAMSGKDVDTQTALSLLQNPTIAKMLAQPELMRDIAQAINEFDHNELKSLTTSRKASATPCSKPKTCSTSKNKNLYTRHKPSFASKPCPQGKPCTSFKPCSVKQKP